MADEKTVTRQRILAYTGPKTWVDDCMARAWVELRKELGNGKEITSEWGEEQEVETTTGA